MIQRTSYAHKRLAKALAVEGYGMEIFSRINGGLTKGKFIREYGYRGYYSPQSTCIIRRRVWLHMRTPDENGLVASYPEIARVCGVSHTTVLTAVQRAQQDCTLTGSGGTAIYTLRA